MDVLSKYQKTIKRRIIREKGWFVPKIHGKYLEEDRDVYKNRLNLS